jgi:hypothetical protein
MYNNFTPHLPRRLPATAESESESESESLPSPSLLLFTLHTSQKQKLKKKKQTHTPRRPDILCIIWTISRLAIHHDSSQCQRNYPQIILPVFFPAVGKRKSNDHVFSQSRHVGRAPCSAARLHGVCARGNGFSVPWRFQQYSTTHRSGETP